MNRSAAILLNGQASVQRLTMSAVPATGALTLAFAGIGNSSSITPVITASPLQTAVRAAGGAMAAAVVITEDPVPPLARSFLISVTGAQAGTMSVSANTLKDSGGASVTCAVSVVSLYVDPTTTVTTIPADPLNFGDVIRLIATQAGQRVTAGSNLQILVSWTSERAGDILELIGDGTNWYRTALPMRELAGAYALLETRRGTFAGAIGSGTRFLLPTGNPVIDSATTGAQTLFPLDPAKIPTVGGKTAKLVLSAYTITNSQAPGISFEFALVEGTTPTGASGTVAYTAGSALTNSLVTLSPNANDRQYGDSGDIALPASASTYAIRIKTTSANAAGADVVVGASVRYHYV